MSNIQQDIQEVQLTIEEAKEIIAMGDAIERLFKNRDFKKVVLEGYFEKEAVRYVKLLGDANLTEKGREEILRDMTGVGVFNYYLHMRRMEADHLREEVKQHEDTLDELRQMEAEGEE